VPGHGPLGRGTHALDDDDRARVEAERAIAAPASKLPAEMQERMTFQAADRCAVQSVKDRGFQIADAAAGLEGQKGPVGRQRHDVDARQPLEDLAVDDNQRIPFADIHQFGVGARIAPGHRAALLELRYDGPRQIRMDLPESADHFLGQGDGDEPARPAEFRWPAPLMTHTRGSLPDDIVRRFA
jgi:hypothetical protein